MKLFRIIFSSLAVVAITLASGVIYGRLSQRWGPSRNTQEAAKKLQAVPKTFGPWQQKATHTFDGGTLEELKCAGYIFRTYEHRLTGEEVNVAIILGPPGQISVHTPEICFSSQDYTLKGTRRQMEITHNDGAKEEFWVTTFQANDLHRRSLSVIYGWSTGGHWMAPKDPRFNYAGYPHVYKIQLVATITSDGKTPGDDPCQKFLAEFVPAAKNCLVESHRD
jgi:hypothetical protein